LRGGELSALASARTSGSGAGLGASAATCFAVVDDIVFGLLFEINELMR